MANTVKKWPHLATLNGTSTRSWRCWGN